MLYVLLTSLLLILRVATNLVVRNCKKLHRIKIIVGIREFLGGLNQMLNLVLHAVEAQKKLLLKANNTSWAHCFFLGLCYKDYPS